MKKNLNSQLPKDLIVLGVNGWDYHGHDASACLLKNGKILSFVEEERFNRQRYAFDAWPVEAIKFCLSSNNLKPTDLDQIAFGWNMPLRYQQARSQNPYDSHGLLKRLFPVKIYPDINHEQLPKIEIVDHHLAHAASCTYVSEFEEASVLVLDGQGETASGWLGVYQDNQLKKINSIPIEYSLGYFMSAVCVFLGLKTHDAGKLMGLAAHGKPKYSFSEFQLTKTAYTIEGMPSLPQRFDHQTPIVDAWLKILHKRFPDHQPIFESSFDKLSGKTVSNLKLDKFSKDLAASAQLTIEEVILHLTKQLVSQTGLLNLAYAGGVALNCTTNGRLLSEDVVDQLYIQPAANDAGVSLGAALEVYASQSKSHIFKMTHCYHGPSFSNQEIKSELTRLKISHSKKNDICKTAAMALSNGKVVAWFQGKMEVGPRALGNRSILANPAMVDMHHLLNVIKSREQWRPLAPSVLEEAIEDLFEQPEVSPYMLLTHKVRPEWQQKIPAIVHVDGTTRYQSVNKKQNPKYHQLISEFKSLTRLPIVMNTSFNTGGEPIVMTPQQAIKTFFTSEIDCLAIGDFWISK